MEVQWPLLVFSVMLGITSGIFIFLAVGEIKNKFKEVRFSGALIAFILLAIGGCVSVFHMGHPERATHLLGNLASGLSMELFATAAMGVVTFSYLLLARKEYPAASKALGIIGGIIGIILPPITGASYLIAARPAWDSITLPLLYLGAGLAMGFVLMAALVLLKGNAKEEGGFALKMALAGVVISAVTVISYMTWVAVAPFQAPTRSIMRFLSGDLALMFWLGVVLIGMIAPIALVGLACFKATKGEGDTGIADSKHLGMYLLVAFGCTVIGTIVFRILFYTIGTSVEQFFYR